MNIILIGPRGSGKSTIGPRLAAAIGWPFVELDDLALKQTGLATVQDVWSLHGEPAWRAAETNAFSDALARHSQVIALGGGAPTVPAIESALQLARLQQESVVVYLQCTVSALQQRLAADRGDRPSLTGTDVVKEVPAVLAAREPIYRRLADLTCDTTERDPATVVTNLVAALEPRMD
jgi:shikimate kinase